MKKYIKSLDIKFLFVLLTMVLIFLIYKDYLEALNFNMNAPDLANMDVEAIKEGIKKDSVSMLTVIGNLDMFKSLIYPIMMVVASFGYYRVLQRNVKYNIGKNRNFEKEKFKLKLTTSVLFILFFLATYIIIVVIAFLFGKINLVIGFADGSVLRGLESNTLIKLLYYPIVEGLALVINMFMMLYITDLLRSPIKAGLIFLSIFWIISSLVNAFVPFYLVPMATLYMTSYIQNIPTLIMCYASIIVISAVFRFASKRQEV